MSISADISRIKSNVASALAAIADKGVTVPDGSTSDALAELIASIQAGGGESNIIIGSFTLNESLNKADPLYIAIPFPKDEFPFMYCVFEDTRGLAFSDTSHTSVRIINVIGIKAYYNSGAKYLVSSLYMKAGTFSGSSAYGMVSHNSNGYANSSGAYGTMDISLADNQIRFKPISDGGYYLEGRTYYYILYWG